MWNGVVWNVKSIECYNGIVLSGTVQWCVKWCSAMVWSDVVYCWTNVWNSRGSDVWWDKILPICWTNVWNSGESDVWSSGQPCGGTRFSQKDVILYFILKF